MEQPARLGAQDHTVEQKLGVGACTGAASEALAAEWLNGWMVPARGKRGHHPLKSRHRPVSAERQRDPGVPPSALPQLLAHPGMPTISTPIRADSQRLAALQREEHLLLGRHSEEVSGGSVLVIREAEVDASVQGS